MPSRGLNNSATPPPMVRFFNTCCRTMLRFSGLALPPPHRVTIEICGADGKWSAYTSGKISVGYHVDDF
jgi:hypothetical protein